MGPKRIYLHFPFLHLQAVKDPSMSTHETIKSEERTRIESRSRTRGDPYPTRETVEVETGRLRKEVKS